uniref:Aspartate/glutamate/uridylate kinase domain-containing protein n=1 Tax=Leersia perrieri TaxID=77586 RepID=A0A0D9V626_9ORYZ
MGPTGQSPLNRTGFPSRLPPETAARGEEAEAPMAAAAVAQEQTNPTASRPVRCIVKLGGAAITNKGELESIDVESLRSACAQLRQAMSHNAGAAEKVVGMDWSRRPGDPTDPVVDAEGLSEMESLGIDTNFVVVHGAGSFGHFQASRSGVHKGGLHSTLVKAGFVATRISVTSLNQEIVRALAREGIPSVGMSPFACGWSTKQRKLASVDASQIIQSLHVGFVPISVASHDTTGGMETKILEAAAIARLGVDVYITKVGTEHSLRALKGDTSSEDWLGTVIRSSK